LQVARETYLFLSKGGIMMIPLILSSIIALAIILERAIQLRRKKVFREIELGAKTGTINDKMDRFKYDWLTAYALPRNGAKGICVAILSVHGKKLGVRANELGRYIINYHLTS